MSFRRTLGVSLVEWIPLAAVIVLLSGAIYIVGQQGYRMTANDPQIQMVTDARNALNAGASPQSLVASDQIDLSVSLAPYLAVYDSSHQLLAASATDKGHPIAPPSEVFDSAAGVPFNAVTWTSSISGVRGAIVVMRYSDGYVLAGRALQQVELREDTLLQLVAAACAGTLVASFCVALLSGLVVARWRSA
ncbi:MAG TPA: hypothetical protein VF807_05580 [Ktedonobacterales bacterium]